MSLDTLCLCGHTASVHRYLVWECQACPCEVMHGGAGSDLVTCTVCERGGFDPAVCDIQWDGGVRYATCPACVDAAEEASLRSRGRK